MARIVTTSLRIASVSLPGNVRLALAAQIFVAAGVLVIFIVNLIWSQRILRAHHPTIGWHKSISIVFTALYVLIVATLIILITATVQSFYTLRPRTRTIDRALQLYGSTFYAIISFLPIVIVALALVIPRSAPLEKFGHGRHRTKVIVLLIGSTLLCLGASFRTGTSWKHPVPLRQPEPGYFSKACFYIFNFGVETIVVYMYAIMRVDLRFWVPDGSKGPGSYAELGNMAEKQRRDSHTESGSEGPEDEETKEAESVV